MPFPIDATPGGLTSNAYVTQARADDLLTEDRLYEAAWSAASSDDKDSALIWGAWLMDASFDYYGSKTYTLQALRLPRSGLFDLDGNDYDYLTIPIIAERADAELALYLLRKDRLAEPGTLGGGFKSAKLGPLAVEAGFMPGQSGVLIPIPRHIVLLMAPIAELNEQAIYGAKTVRLRRS